MESLILGGVCLLLLVITCFRGYRQGFLRLAFSMVMLIASIILVGIIHPSIQGFLQVSPMQKAIYNTVYHNMEGKRDDLLQTIGEGTDSKSEVVLTEEQQKEWMTLSNIPQWIQKNAVQQTEQMSDQVIDNVSTYVADTLINLISYVFTFLLIFALIEGISLMLGIVNHIPIIGGLNRKLGAVLGILQGLVILWILSMLLTIFAPSEWGGQLIAIIESNPILAAVYHFMIGIGHIK